MAHLPPAGGYVEIQDERILLGGEAANTATALNAWGAYIELAGNSLGMSAEFEALREQLRSKGLNTHLLEGGIGEGPQVAPVCDIYITPDGERTMFGMGFGRMNAGRPVEHLPFQAGEWFTAEPNMGDRAREAVRAAAARGMKLYLMDFIREDDPIFPGSFWQSSTDWAGHRNNMQRNVHWLQAFVAKHACFAILSDGPNGFVAGSPQHPVRAYPPFPAPEVLDTTGAGDMFRAGMLLGLDRNWSIPECLRFASAAGCLKCASLGATSRVPSEAEIVAHIAAHPAVARQYE